MKKILVVILVFSLIFCLFGCGENQKTLTDDKTSAQNAISGELMPEAIPEEASFMYYYHKNFGKNSKLISIVNMLGIPPLSAFFTDLGGASHEAALNEAINSMAFVDFYFKKAKNDGFILSDGIKKAAESSVANHKIYAQYIEKDFEEYLVWLYGDAMTLQVFNDIILTECYVNEYVDYLRLNQDVSDTEIYERQNTPEIKRVDLRVFGFDVSAFGKTEAVKQAREMQSRITDEESFVDLAYEYCSEADKAIFINDSATLATCVKKNNIISNFGEDLADWIYANERQNGDTIVFDGGEYTYVVYVIRSAYIVNEPLVDARHILISFESTANELNATPGSSIDTTVDYTREVKTVTLTDNITITNANTAYSIELIEETYNRANAIYKEYLAGEKNEENFAALAENYSDDLGSIGKNGIGGGLYLGIERGKMVTPFEDWIYDENRQPGDVAIIMTMYGWHIMYFVRQHDEPYWKEEVRQILSAEQFEIMQQEYKETIAKTADKYTEKLPVDKYSEIIINLVEMNTEEFADVYNMLKSYIR